MTKIRPKLDAARFHAELQLQDDVASCASLFKAAVAPFGFDVFACGEVDLADRDRNVMFLVEWPTSWMKYYASSGFIERDPILNALKIYRRAFTWSDIIKNRKFSKLDREALRFAAQHGWTQGLVVPVPRGGTRYGLVSLVGRSRGLTPNQRSQLCLISECLLTRVRSLTHRCKFPIAPAGLTEREIESLKLVALGCSDAGIAKALGISASTAHKHVEGCRKRLKARTRGQMTALGVSLGIIDTV